MWKVLLILAVLLMILSAAARAADDDKPEGPTGIFYGSARGYRGPVTVKVILQNGRIVSVKVVRHRENRARNSLTVIPKRIAKAQITQVDAVSRATVTSNAIMKATADAIAAPSADPVSEGRRAW